MYRFRFVSTKHVQHSLGQKNIQSAQLRLKVLRDRGYIDRNYSSRDRLTGRYASYFLLSKGIRALSHQRRRECHPKALHWIYKDRTASWPFADHQMSLGDIHAQLQEHYGDRLTFLTKSDLVEYGDALTLLPDAYVRLTKGVKQRAPTKPANGSHYLLDYYSPDLSYFNLRYRIREYLDDSSSGGEWEAVIGAPLTAILMVCANVRVLNRVIKLVKKKLERLYFSEIKVMVTTKAKLLKSANEKGIWTEVDDSEDDE